MKSAEQRLKELILKGNNLSAFQNSYNEVVEETLKILKEAKEELDAQQSGILIYRKRNTDVDSPQWEHINNHTLDIVEREQKEARKNILGKFEGPVKQ